MHQLQPGRARPRRPHSTAAAYVIVSARHVHVQIHTQQVVLITAMIASQIEDHEALELARGPHALLHDRLDTLSRSSPLLKIAPAIASIFTTPGEMNVQNLTCLFEHCEVTADIFGACLDHAMTVDVTRCLDVLRRALNHFSKHESLITCLWHVKV